MKNRFAWRVTGSDEEIKEILDVMKTFSSEHEDVDVRVFVSKAGYASAQVGQCARRTGNSFLEGKSRVLIKRVLEKLRVSAIILKPTEQRQPSTYIIAEINNTNLSNPKEPSNRESDLY